MIVLAFAFLSGLVTILTPCIWPLLPIILSSSVATGKRRPLGITAGVMVSFTVFTLSISYIVRVFKIDPDVLRLIAVVVIILMGLSLLIPKLGQLLELAVSRLTNRLGGKLNNQQGFWGGFLNGFTLGIIWSPCAGPILATIAALSVTGMVSTLVVLITMSYILGVGIPLFLIALSGQWLVSRTRFLSARTGLIQKVFGFLMILVAIMIYTNYDKYLQAKILSYFPGLNNALSGFEQSAEVQKSLAVIRGKNADKYQQLAEGIFNANEPAPEIVGIERWLNLADDKQSLKLADLRGKVVLVDFWTYTCINCIRTLPHLTAWYEKYKDWGFVVIGVHTPEFEFEKKTANVIQAIERYRINYPVAQDNNYATWNNYNNLYWPAEYLIDDKGRIRRTHFGEGEYEQTELAIQTLLREAGQQIDLPLEEMADETPRMRISPETYLGSERNPSGNNFSLGGDWVVMDDRAVSGTGATLDYSFYASKVFLVMRPAAEPKKVKVFMDGKFTREILVDSDRLYELINLDGKVGNHLLYLELESGVEAFAFTFG